MPSPNAQMQYGQNQNETSKYVLTTILLLSFMQPIYAPQIDYIKAE